MASYGGKGMEKEEHWIRSITTTAGDMERESKSRLYNLLEALGIMVFILVLLWPVAYLFGVLGKNNTVNTLANILIFAGALYLLFVSPFVHKDTLNSWGLGNPWTLWRMLREGSSQQRGILMVVIVVLFIGLNYANLSQWREVEEFFKFNKLASFFGFPDAHIEQLNTSFPGIFFVLVFGSLLSFLIITFGIRYDNFGSAFKTAMIVALPLLAVTFLAAFLHRGLGAFEKFRIDIWAIGVLGYVFWGFVQQLLFSSYFGTRFRKAFAPSRSPNNVVPPSKRPKMMLAFGVCFSVISVALVFIGISCLYGASRLSLTILGWLAVFTFPMGLAYGYFFCRDKKRLLVATLCATCFGLIHIDSYGLVAVTWGLGIILVYVFMEEKNRNLVALGFIHGLLGSSFGQLFSHKESGILEVDYGVGPWHVDDPAATGLIFPLLCIAGYVALMAWAINHLEEDPK
ncbi:MAG TPA: hypothetical protein PLI09_26210 [Candidatus Hydrogenedentes bacterium]|nr:hypothetical protein [Candidatus Hydrogenedentota bacterium]